MPGHDGPGAVGSNAVEQPAISAGGSTNSARTASTTSGLQVSLAGAKDKITQIDASMNPHGPLS